MDNKRLQQKILGKRIYKKIKRVINDILDIIFPAQNKCISCKEDGWVGICSLCKSKIVRVQDNDEILCYGYYKGTIKKLILNMKYKKDFLSIRVLGDMLVEISTEYINDIDYIYFIPLSKKSYKKRGYNQSELLANIISEKFDIKVSKNLIKIKETKEQKKLSKDERKKNVLGAFDLRDKSEVQNTNILLIDDVYTTGETLKEAKKILKKFGASTIKILTVSKSVI